MHKAGDLVFKRDGDAYVIGTVMKVDNVPVSWCGDEQIEVQFRGEKRTTWIRTKLIGTNMKLALSGGIEW